MLGDVRGKVFPLNEYNKAVAHKEACGGLMRRIEYMGISAYEVRYVPMYHSYDEQCAFENGFLPINPS